MSPRDGRVAAVSVILLAAVLIFVRLDQRLLWSDEAETALLARNILVYGIPKAHDGRNLVSQEVGRDYDENYVWRWTPWLDKYVAAASFALFGESTFSARLPFAVAGVLAVASVYPLASLLFRDRWVSVLSMAFLGFSLPFILHVRQCRYYSLAILASIWAAYFFIRVRNGTRWAVAGFVAAMTVLFHSNYLTFVGTAAALAPGVIIFDRAAVRRGALAAVLIVVLNGPWFFYFSVLGKSEERLYSFTTNLRSYLELTNQYSFPALALLLFLALVWFLQKKHPLLNQDSRRTFLALLLACALYLVTISLAPWFFYRYTVNLLPVFAVLLAFMCARVWSWNRFTGAAVTTCLLFTGLFHTASAYPLRNLTDPSRRQERSFAAYDTFFPVGNYLSEITHRSRLSMEGVIHYLVENGRPVDRVYVSYGDLPLKFYTAYEVRGGQTGQSLEDWPPPEWIVLRSFFRFGDRPHLRADAVKTRAWLRRVPQTSYREIALPYVDVWWENIPEPHLHWYRVPTKGERVRIFRRVTAP